MNRSVEKQWMLAAYTVRPAAEAVPGVPGRLLSRTDRGPWHCTHTVAARSVAPYLCRRRSRQCRPRSNTGHLSPGRRSPSLGLDSESGCPGLVDLVSAALQHGRPGHILQRDLSVDRLLRRRSRSTARQSTAGEQLAETLLEFLLYTTMPNRQQCTSLRVYTHYARSRAVFSFHQHE